MKIQNHLYYAQPETTSLSTTIVAVRPHALGAALAVADNIVRPAGGGEPRDLAVVRHACGDLAICGAEKSEGLTWLAVGAEATGFRAGDPVAVELDAEHRRRRRLLHTAVHLVIRSAYDHFGEITVAEAEIGDDARSAIVRGGAPCPVAHADILAVDRTMRSEVMKARPVVATAAKTVELARSKYGALFRLSDRHALNGRIRLVCIDGYDVNPCSGLHHPSSDIGPYELNEGARTGGPDEFHVRISLANAWTYWFGSS